MLYYLLIINALAFLFMLTDKLLAIRHKRRIPEATLLTAAALGGSLGALLGMWICHHKTRKPKFFITVPLLLGIHALLLYFLFLQ